jgi:FtsH-binding integral membrane protein
VGTTSNKAPVLLRPTRLVKESSALYATRYAFQRIKVQKGTGQTLKEKLLGPTTGKPYLYGTIGLACGSAAGIGMLCYYGLGLSSEIGAREKYGVWPDYVKKRIHSTYFYLAGSLGLTAASAVTIFRTPALFRLASRNSLTAMFVTIAALVGTGHACRVAEYRPGTLSAKHALWLLHTGVMGAVIAPLCIMGGPLLLRAALYTAGIAGGLSLVAVCAPGDKFLSMGGPLAMGLGLVFISNIGAFFVPPTSALGAGLISIVMYGGLVLFGGFLLYDTQRVIKMAEATPPPDYLYGNLTTYDPINAQMGIYMDVMNMFIRIAMIMSGSRRK